MFTASPTQDQCIDILQGCLATILPQGTEIWITQQNRVPEPKSDDYVLMTPLFKRRLSTNVDIFHDIKFTASVAGNLMTVTGMDFGVIEIGNQLFGIGVPGIVLITAQVSGTVGGTGVYQLSGTATLASGTMSCGLLDLNQSLQFTCQLDVHGPNSGDNVVVISTIFRDNFGYDLFQTLAADEGLAVNTITPIAADDPRQMPFVNDQMQYELRWTIEAEMQVNQLVEVPQQYMDIVKTTLVDVTTAYPS